ncbi:MULTISPECIES: alpha/beta fold hydrolase [Niastella]|uniref:Alpha/beta hydrolase n=1 Tax=Niastella soli TaxID=2821487 RepID=A0ABS3YSW9_9BACT|nr:alpha/beta hydrolase [Niastella soli]MBO9201017.1 alpha/beta hydrolase [Niastella soli]
MQTKQKTESGYVSINGIKMYYEIHGESSLMPLVLIHGGGSTIPSNWGTVLPLFANEYKVIAMELQAHGRTSDRETEESFKQDAADVIALLQQLKVSKANFAGFSNGGSTTLEILINYPHIVNKAVVISCSYKRDGMITGFFDGLQQATFNDMPEVLNKAFLDVNPDKKGLLNMFNKDRARMLAFPDRSDADMQSIKAPVLVMAGDQDVVTIEHTVQMHKAIPGSRLAVLPGNHGSFIGEAMAADPGSNIPEMTVGIIKEFLNRT